MPTVTVTFPEGTRMDAQLDETSGGHIVHTDMSAAHGGTGTAPEPGALFLTSLATCSGWYAAQFCTTRDISTEGLGLTMETDINEKEKQIERITLKITLPHAFPEKYHKAILRAVDQCFVKKHLSKDIAFETVLD